MNHTKTMEGNQENLRKKNMSIKIVGGGGLAGIILLGGAVALVTTFAFKRKHRSKNKQEGSLKKCIVKKDPDLSVGEGLSFLVSESLSPHLDYSPSNGTVNTQDEVSTQILLDDYSETNGRNNEETDIPEMVRDNTFYDKSSINKEEFPVPVNKKNDSLDEVEDQLGLDGKAHKQGEECDGNGKTIIKRKEIVVEGAQSNQPGTNDDSHKLDDECDENGESILEKREEPVEAAVVDQTRLDEKTHKRAKECNVAAGIIIEEGEELIGEVVGANGIILSEELEAITTYGDQDILCSGGTVLIRNETDSCDLKKLKLLLPLMDSSSVIKPGYNDLFEDHLVVEDTKILKGDEATKPPVQEDHSKVEDREQTQVVEANGDNKECCMIYRENTNDKFEEADEISVKNDQQMQSGDECQKIHINGDQDKYNSGKSLPESNSIQSNGFEVPEFSFLPIDRPSLFKPGKLHEYDSAQTTLHVEVINPVEKDRLAEENFADQIMLENKPSVQSAKNDEMQICDDGCDSAQPRELSGEEDNNDDSKEDVETVEVIQRENFEVENNQQLPQKDHDYNDNDDNVDEGVEDDSDEEEDIDNDTEEDDVEETSETTGDSSLNSNAEGIWPDESVLEFSRKVRDMQANNQQNLKEIEEEDSYVKFNSHKLDDDAGDSFMMDYSEKLSADTTTLKQPTNIFNLKFWVLSLLVPFLLLLWLSLSQLSYFASFQYHLE